MSTAAAFCRCDSCQAEWPSREAFLADREVVVVGYQANPDCLDKGLFLFNHSCRSLLPVEVAAFADLATGPVFAERLLGSENCSGLCLRRDALAGCLNPCECAYVRDILAQLARPRLND